jgi:hypothetical protein
MMAAQHLLIQAFHMAESMPFVSAAMMACALLLNADAKVPTAKALVQTLDARQSQENDKVRYPIMKEKLAVGPHTLYVRCKGKKCDADSIMSQALLRKYPDQFHLPEKISGKGSEKNTEKIWLEEMDPARWTGLT